jgi:hypothetical protein
MSLIQIVRKLDFGCDQNHLMKTSWHYGREFLPFSQELRSVVQSQAVSQIVTRLRRPPPILSLWNWREGICFQLFPGL